MAARTPGGEKPHQPHHFIVKCAGQRDRALPVDEETFLLAQFLLMQRELIAETPGKAAPRLPAHRQHRRLLRVAQPASDTDDSDRDGMLLNLESGEHVSCPPSAAPSPSPTVKTPTKAQVLHLLGSGPDPGAGEADQHFMSALRRIVARSLGGDTEVEDISLGAMRAHLKQYLQKRRSSRRQLSRKPASRMDGSSAAQAMSLVSSDEEDEEDDKAAPRKRADVQLVAPHKRKRADDSPPKSARPRPLRAAAAAAAAAEEDGAMEGDFEVVGTSAEFSLPHIRAHCPKATRGTAAEALCDLCYCHVCDAKASACGSWAAHCHATDVGPLKGFWLRHRREAAARRGSGRPPPELQMVPIAFYDKDVKIVRHLLPSPLSPAEFLRFHTHAVTASCKESGFTAQETRTLCNAFAAFRAKCGSKGAPQAAEDAMRQAVAAAEEADEEVTIVHQPRPAPRPVPAQLAPRRAPPEARSATDAARRAINAARRATSAARVATNAARGTTNAAGGATNAARSAATAARGAATAARSAANAARGATNAQTRKVPAPLSTGAAMSRKAMQVGARPQLGGGRVPRVPVVPAVSRAVAAAASNAASLSAILGHSRLAMMHSGASQHQYTMARMVGGDRNARLWLEAAFLDLLDVFKGSPHVVPAWVSADDRVHIMRTWNARRVKRGEALRCGRRGR